VWQCPPLCPVYRELKKKKSNSASHVQQHNHHVTGRPSGEEKKSEIQVCSMISFRNVKGLALVKIHHRLVEVHKAQIIIIKTGVGMV